MLLKDVTYVNDVNQILVAGPNLGSPKNEIYYWKQWTIYLSISLIKVLIMHLQAFLNCCFVGSLKRQLWPSLHVSQTFLLLSFICTNIFNLSEAVYYCIKFSYWVWISNFWKKNYKVEEKLREIIMWIHLWINIISEQHMANAKSSLFSKVH